MQYSIKELDKHWISKNLVYEALKNSLPFSKEFIKNKRVFNEQDLKLFEFYKFNWLEKTTSKYWTVADKTVNQTIWKLFKENDKQFLNIQIEDFKKSLLDELETVKKQFLEKETNLKQEIEQKEKIIGIKEEQAQKYALMKTEEQKEKEEWIKKYDVLNNEKGEWMKKFYSTKTYLIVFAILFMLSTAALLFRFL